MWPHSKSILKAFPRELSHELGGLMSATFVIDDHKYPLSDCFSVKLNSEALKIPTRIYSGKVEGYELLPALQKHLIDCLYTRHYNGYIREENLKKTILLNEPWAVPYIVHLLGEPVIEIIQVIDDNIDELDKKIYSTFINENVSFYEKTKDRVASYWNCYHRHNCISKDDYVGFKVVKAFDSF